MDIQLKKWGNSIGFLIPHKIAESFGIDENSTIELTESNGTLVIKKKQKALTLDELLSTIPNDFRYPEDVNDFVASEPIGQEIL
ncbi:AbrB/MazE/SpoVT family DNA-binding domain-containing protein [Pseudanabaena sp. ABRG5-3]|uniref:AbrB/MazE/SpoVT family DNA-binding domain-containing protein n=1 Tax=Pseudanabaena sp. ABRG5-3 TaxID=685565 RepID=UPI000DC6F2FA|nr:AbrB/MazE/SpoVT family DNA-binding domain-containing protein [Pseudanabaena sp. ABRG5-3]BBC26510.1 suppressor of ppGpp-regulated growth inhibitor ChpA/MazF [Pseudanabaena sp. ABRG5-3]